MGAKTEDPSPDQRDARDDRLTAVDFSEGSAVGRQSILCLLSHTTATISVKSSWSQHRRNMNCGKWRTRVEFVFGQRGATHRIQTMRLYPAGVPHRS